MSDDPAHDRIAAIVKALSELVTQPPTLIGFDFADLRDALHDKGRAVFGQGEASGENRAIRAAELALADIRQQLRPEGEPPQEDDP
jgi:cell division protein FtsZ